MHNFVDSLMYIYSAILCFGCWMSLVTKFQFYCGCQFYWPWKQEKTIDLPEVTDKMYQWVVSVKYTSVCAEIELTTLVATDIDCISTCICKRYVYINATTIYKCFTTTRTPLMYISRRIVYKIQIAHSSFSFSPWFVTKMETF